MMIYCNDDDDDDDDRVCLMFLLSVEEVEHGIRSRSGSGATLKPVHLDATDASRRLRLRIPPP